MAKRGSQGEALYTLTEVSAKTGISMPTLQRYKRSYQDRLPTVGKGRRQRYPAAALEVFEEIKAENIARRGRPRKESSGGDAKSAAKPKQRRVSRAKARRERRRASGTGAPRKASEATASKQDLLTLTEIKERTGISYPTLSRYVRQDPDRFPSVGEGRRRRYHPAAVQAFQSAYEEGKSSRGRRPAQPKSEASAPATSTRRTSKAASAGGAELKKRINELERRVKDLEKRLSKDLKLRFTIPGR
ncbi:MAG: helix-turn-helix domain-containing protein [Acidobacteriota bacterium]